MSRRYRMDIMVRTEGLRLKECAVVVDAVETLWPIDTWDTTDKTHTGSGECTLGGGQTEEEFAHEMRVAIWQAVNRYVEVVITATYLENLPYTKHEATERTYDKWRADVHFNRKI